MANPVNPTPPQAPLPRPSVAPTVQPQQSVRAKLHFHRAKMRKFTRDSFKGALLMGSLGGGIWAAHTYHKNHNNKPGVTPYTSAQDTFTSLRAKQFLAAKSDKERSDLEDKMVQALADGGAKAATNSYHATPEQADSVRISLQDTYKVTIHDIDGKRYLYQAPLSPNDQGQRNELQAEVSASLHIAQSVVSHPASAPSKPKKPSAGA